MGIPTQIIIALLLGIKRNWHIFFGLIAGVIVGCFCPKDSYPIIYNVLDFIGHAFLSIIQMVVLPLVISAIVIGIASVGDNKQLAKFGKKMIFYYGIMTIVAVTLGAVLALVIQPGANASHLINQSVADSVKVTIANAINSEYSNIFNVFLELIPKNPIISLSHDNIVPTIIFTLVFAIALSKIGDMNRPVVSFFESIFAATMKVTDWIMYLAAPGVFALTAASISEFGLEIFSSVGKYVLVVLIGLFLQFFVVYPVILKIFSKIPIAKLYGAMTEAIMVAFGTASSSATLPLTMTCCEKRGISNKICSFVLPLGATLSMDGTALVQTVAVIFLMQAYGMPLTLGLILKIALMAIIASSTCAGITGAGLITIALILNALGLTPELFVQGFAILYALDRFVDMTRTAANVMSDAVVAGVIADSENEIDYELLNSDNLNGDK